MTSHQEATTLLVAMEYLDGCEQQARDRFFAHLTRKYPAKQAEYAGPPRPGRFEVPEDIAKALAERQGKQINPAPAVRLQHPPAFQRAEIQRDLSTQV